ncbi:MAG: hypothetical protein IJA65_05410, partial [Acholeplasmatales bacterium]|nr:hypothetical protein [Acholeplasmatales bacterium]
GNGNYLYYNTLREMGISHEEILYGIAIPQKKGFLLGDSGDEYTYNLEINVSFANNIFKNLEDRLPKIRGGIAYLYNNIVDSWQYNKYRVILVGKNAKNIGSKNAKYKCALVNQGIICGLGGSVRAEHNIYRGVDTLLKNNDSGVSGELLRGGFAFINMQYQLFETDTPYTSSTTKANHQFNSAKYNASTATLSSNYFSWHNDENASPFTPTLYNVADLEETLYNTCPVGVNKDIDAMYLYTKYSDYIYEG